MGYEQKKEWRILHPLEKQNSLIGLLLGHFKCNNGGRLVILFASKDGAWLKLWNIFISRLMFEFNDKLFVSIFIIFSSFD